MVTQFEQRIKLLQKKLTHQHLDAFFVPRGDRYQGEYVVAADERLAWLTGFTGSAGLAVIFPHRAALFVDGRYFLQAQQDMPSGVEVILTSDKKLKDYLKEHLKPGAIIGYDPWLHTVQEKKQWEVYSQQWKWVYQPLEVNPIDEIWEDQPSRPRHQIFLLEDQFSGVSAHEKIAQIVNKLKQTGANLAYLSAPETFCWLLNIRGEDFPYTPLVDGLAFLDDQGIVTLFMGKEKISSALQKKLRENVHFLAEEQLDDFLSQKKNDKILIHAASTPIWIREKFSEQQCMYGDDLCALPKACKNPIEQDGMRQAHVKDGIALARFLCWLSHHLSSLTEIDVVEKLEFYRQQGENYWGPSFPTIAGYESNGAIVHYRPQPSTNKLIKEGSLLLLDSGGQYLEGTTDVTRTIAIGAPSQEQREFFTRVLKGHIALARVHFPEGTCGQQLDILARQYLWEIGEDFDHGTGHGVGSFLNVHEGPQRISKGGSQVKLQPGMVLSNEPGYYKAHEYGIRIENLVMVKPSPLQNSRPFYCFETLSLVPIDINLVIIEWLTAEEREWLNHYHQTIRSHLLPLLEPETAGWLIEVTESI